MSCTWYNAILQNNSIMWPKFLIHRILMELALCIGAIQWQRSGFSSPPASSSSHGLTGSTNTLLSTAVSLTLCLSHAFPSTFIWWFQSSDSFKTCSLSQSVSWYWLVCLLPLFSTFCFHSAEFWLVTSHLTSQQPETSPLSQLSSYSYCLSKPAFQ